MTNTELSSQIEMALLESPVVAQVLAVEVGAVDDRQLVAARVSVLGAATAEDIMPIIATLRARVRELAPDAEVFIEVDATAARSHDLSTEAIVIRSMD